MRRCFVVSAQLSTSSAATADEMMTEAAATTATVAFGQFSVHPPKNSSARVKKPAVAEVSQQGAEANDENDKCEGQYCNDAN